MPDASKEIIGVGRWLTFNGYTDMLVLGRRLGETLIIGGDIKITVLAVHGNEVRIGIDAPKDVSVHREEIYQRIQAQKGFAVPRRS